MAEQAKPLGEVEVGVDELVRSRRWAEAAGACLAEHGAAVGRLAIAFLGSAAEAEEVVQDTMIAAYHGLPAFRAEGSLRAWLFGIARNLCARRLESQARQARAVEAPLEVREDVPDLLLHRKQRATRVRALLAALPPSERDVLVLRYQGELSFREVAAACGIDEAAARKRASRGLMRLRERMQGHKENES